MPTGSYAQQRMSQFLIPYDLTANCFRCIISLERKIKTDKMMKNFIFIFVLFAVLAFSDTSLFAREKYGDIEVTAEGMATDKKAALLEAKRSAIEEGLGIVITSETEVRNFTLMRDKILTRTKGAVKSYKILDEKVDSGNLYVIKIKAVVSLESINKDLAALGVLLESMDKPRVMVLIDEKIGGKRTTNCETEIVDKLLDFKFNMVDPSTVAALFDAGDDIIMRASAGDKNAAVKIGTANGAEVIIVGNVKTSSGTPVYNMKSARADISVQAIVCATGKIIASKNVQEAAIHISDESAAAESIRKASQNIIENTKKGKVVTSLFDKIIGSWQEMVNNGTPFRLIVNNVLNFKTSRKVKSVIESLSSNVVSVTQRGWKKPVLELEVVYKGTSETFSENIDGKVLPDIGSLDVSGLTAGSVSLEIN